MSRIDDALRRLTGAPAEPRPSVGLERFASEGKIPRHEEPPRFASEGKLPRHEEPPRFASEGKLPRLEESRKPQAHDEHRVASFVAAGPHPVETRVVPPKPVIVHAPPPAPPEHAAAAPEPADPDAEPEGETLFDIKQIADYVGFVYRAIGRHKLLASGTFALVLALTALVVIFVPRTYYVEVKLLAQRNAVMTALSNPGRAVPWDADAPTRAAAETVLRRDNLISLITQTDLITETERRLAPVLRLKNWIAETIFGYVLTPDEKLDALVAQLEENMLVTAGPIGDGTVTIELYWSDPEMAYRLVERAQEAFLEARQVAETSAIQESISILERYADSLNRNISKTLGEIDRTTVREVLGAAAGRTVPTVVRRTTRPAAGTVDAAQAALAAPPPVEDVVVQDPELSRLRNAAASKRQELARLESERSQQINEGQQKLAALKRVYTESHPSVQSATQSLTALQYESPRLVALRNELDKLEAEYDEKSAQDADRLLQATLSRPAAPGPVAPRAAAPERETVIVETTPAPTATQREQAQQFSTLRLRTELNQLQSILERTDSARIELAVSQAAFKYRYTVIKPAQEPRDPSSPNLRLLGIGGFLLALVFAVGIGVSADLVSNRILEAWQVQRQLGLPLFGTVTQ
jgi:uncharacterized protein involved in exopolysaccharide biosynthesis